MLKNLINCLILISLTSCANNPPRPKLNVNFEYLTNPDGVVKACLAEDDIIQLFNTGVFKCSE